MTNTEHQPTARDLAMSQITTERKARAMRLLTALFGPDHADYHTRHHTTLQSVQEVSGVVDTLRIALQHLEIAARAEGATWADLAAAEQVTRQAVQQRLGSEWKYAQMHALAEVARSSRPNAVVGEQPLPDLD